MHFHKGMRVKHPTPELLVGTLSGPLKMHHTTGILKRQCFCVYCRPKKQEGKFRNIRAKGSERCGQVGGTTGW